MRPADEKMLEVAMDRVHYTLVEAENFRRRAPGFVKAFKAQLKATPSKDAERVLKNVAPIIPKLLSKSKTVDKDLETLLDLGSANAHDYHDGREFRDRNQKLLESAKVFDGHAARVVLNIKALEKLVSPEAKGPNKKWVAPLLTVPGYKVTVDSLTEFTRRWNDLRIAINRI